MNQNESSHISDPALLIMTSLASGPKHGYAMIEDIARFADVRLGPGTLYGALARLEQRGWIAAVPSDDRRRPYQLTSSGDAALREQLAALESVTRLGLQRLGMSAG
jgi:DNA-binding PadR family transcriptional regulator